VTALSIPADRVIVDNRIAEFNSGVFDGKPAEEFNRFFGVTDWATKKPENGESYTDVRRRVGDFIYDIESKYDGKTILIITHDSPAWLLFAIAKGLNTPKADVLCGENDFFMKNAEVKRFDFVPLPHNDNYDVDFHRPYIDEVVLTDGSDRLVRVPEVFDCWFESGSMPYAESHYPFDRKEFDPAGILSHITLGLLGKGKGYPADFIAEGLDQTRGWFYSMLVLGVALFGRSPYKRVIVNGLILAEDGQKMSKSKKNYPDPNDVLTKYGADALRYYLLSSPVVKGQDFCFSERGVDEVAKKHIGRLLNVVTFYEMYASKEGNQTNQRKNPLDIWIVSRLGEVVSLVTKGLDDYELDVATRPFADFIDDLSTWYLRRSRDRFKGEDTSDRSEAISTTRYVLSVTAKLLAPFMPFVAEEIYGRIGGTESVHLTNWPEGIKVDEEIIGTMKETRKIASLALEARSRAKINVRQPLARLTVQKSELNRSVEANPAMVMILKDEVNIEDVVFAEKVAEEISLDTNITPELREAGRVREVMRAVQDARKTSGLSVGDMGTARVTSSEEDLKVIERHKGEIMKSTGLSHMEMSVGDTLSVVIER
jgi:isoleucyl-tRNA synthetase